LIDLHCHLLPGLDDGAQNLQTSLTMARAAVDQGVTHVACTPHIITITDRAFALPSPVSRSPESRGDTASACDRR
jgi:hypothetical protein